MLIASVVSPSVSGQLFVFQARHTCNEWPGQAGTSCESSIAVQETAVLSFRDSRLKERERDNNNMTILNEISYTGKL